MSGSAILAAPGGLSQPWRRALLALVPLWAALLLLFGRDWADMGAIWWSSSTFEHILLIPVILGWLGWQRGPKLARLKPTGWAPGLLIVGAGAFGWLLGDAAGVALARHLGVVMMMQGAVVACLGPPVSRALLFPLVFALFLVPAGEELVPALQTLTAHMCMGLLALVGIPAHLEGVFITTPAGYFEVAEACSGIKFLIAMLAFGVLAANQCFVSWPRRIAFIALAVSAPVLANGVRAWGTIVYASFTTAEAATGFDHIVYGWIFFAIVVALVLAIGWPFFDRDPAAPMVDVDRLPSVTGGRNALTMATAALAIALAPPAWSALVAAGADPVAPLFAPKVAGWTHVPYRPGTPWAPRYDGADRTLIARYRDGAGRTVDLAVAAYARQAEGREIVGYGQGPLDPDSDWAWSADAVAPPHGKAMHIVAPGPARREVLIFNRIGDAMTGSDVEAKLLTLKARLAGGDQRAVALLVSAEGEGSRAAISAFLAASGGPERLADNAAPR